jgi:hypothetical protein
MHCVGVEVCGYQPRQTGVEGEGAAAVHDPVEIVAGDRVEAGMKVLVHGLCREDCDRMRSQVGVESLPQAEGVE